jgi:hypothetical protein
MVPRWQRSIAGSLVAAGLVVACSSGTPWNNGDGGGSAPMSTASAKASGSSSGAPSTGSGAGFDSGPADAGGGEAAFTSSGSTVVIAGNDGGPCQMCNTDSDCQTSCVGMTLMPGYLWCCQSSICIMWGAKTCPMPVASGSGGGSGGGATCGGAMQPCCSMDPACQMGLMCDQQSGMCQ